MPLITFNGLAAERLWGHVKDHLGLLTFVPDLESRDEEKRRVSEVAVVTFMATAAWGYNRVSDARYGSRFGRFLYLSRINRDIYKVARAKTPVVVRVHCREETHMFELGRAIGFSAVLPLSETGFRNYCLNSKAMSQLEEEDIVSNPYQPNTIPFLLVAGLVDFHALAPYLGGIQRFPRKAHGLLARLGRQVGNFLPKVDLWLENGIVYGATTAGQKLPTILCPLSGAGMGENLLKTAGFQCEGTDRMNNQIWIIDFDEMNGREKEDNYLKKLFKAYRYVNSCCE